MRQGGSLGQGRAREEIFLKIAILGTGAVGATLGARWAQAGHSIVFGSRQPEGDKARQAVERCGPGARALFARQAAAQGEAILLAVPWSAARGTIAECGDLEGRTLMDCVNPLLADLSGLELGHSTSAAEQIAAWAPSARVVKVFNTASARVMNDPRFGEQAATMFYCGDDAAAKETVRRLVADIGFDPVDAGPLASSRNLEPLAMLYIHLAMKQGWGSHCAFKMLKRTPTR
jgi:8-hydroxy-5-deazaflavin:NADPH oxidoreductase